MGVIPGSSQVKDYYSDDSVKDDCGFFYVVVNLDTKTYDIDLVCTGDLEGLSHVAPTILAKTKQHLM